MKYSHIHRIVSKSEGPMRMMGLKPGYQGRLTAKLGEIPYELSLSTMKLGFWDARLTAAYPEARASRARRNIIGLVDTLREVGN